MESRQLSFDEVIARQTLASRNIGMTEAEFAETLSGSDYLIALEAAIKFVAKRQSEVHIDDVLRVLKAKPKHPNSAGSVWMRMQRDGTLGEEIERRRCLTDVNKKAHKYPVYESGLFYERKSA